MDGAYLRFCGAPQKRKGIDSLARLCQEKLAEDPFSGCVFVFRSRSGTAIRLLSYDGQGYWLAQERLSKGRFAWWPEATGPTKPLEAYEAQLLMAAGALAAMLAPARNTEKTSAVLEEPENPETGDGTQPDTDVSPQPGHGRHGAEAFGGAQTVDVSHQKLTHGERCPDCVAQLKYGSGTPFYRLEKLEGQLGIPLPSSDAVGGLSKRPPSWSNRRGTS
jgi:transposase